jgi:hypothetical protein
VAEKEAAAALVKMNNSAQADRNSTDSTAWQRARARNEFIPAVLRTGVSVTASRLTDPHKLIPNSLLEQKSKIFDDATCKRECDPDAGALAHASIAAPGDDECTWAAKKHIMVRQVAMRNLPRRCNNGRVHLVLVLAKPPRKSGIRVALRPRQPAHRKRS